MLARWKQTERICLGKGGMRYDDDVGVTLPCLGCFCSSGRLLSARCFVLCFCMYFSPPAFSFLKRLVELCPVKFHFYHCTFFSYIYLFFLSLSLFVLFWKHFLSSHVHLSFSFNISYLALLFISFDSRMYRINGKIWHRLFINLSFKICIL